MSNERPEASENPVPGEEAEGKVCEPEREQWADYEAAKRKLRGKSLDSAWYESLLRSVARWLGL